MDIWIDCQQFDRSIWIYSFFFSGLHRKQFSGNCSEVKRHLWFQAKNSATKNNQNDEVLGE